MEIDKRTKLLHLLVAEFGGSKLKLAAALGVSKSAISHYFKMGGLTALTAIKVEILTEGKFKAVDTCFEV
jgi:predicted transcriptional regulator